MDIEIHSKELDLIHAMRKTLSSVIKDISPSGGKSQTLSEATVNEIKSCLHLISEREREIYEANGHTAFRPHFVNESVKESLHQNAKVIKFHSSEEKPE